MPGSTPLSESKLSVLLATDLGPLPIPELVENRRRSVAMLEPGVPALNREEALELLAQLEAALLELRQLRTEGERAVTRWRKNHLPT